MCRLKGKSAEQCQNYVRVLKLQAPDTLFVCGTNAYKPRCRTYIVTHTGYELVTESPGEGACPYQENQNVTSLFVGGELYTGTATQFSGIDGLIHRAPLRTEQFNPKQLNSPNFVSSFRYGDHVYFLFREIAIEHINCGKTVYSRIARVCINDAGGATRANRERWTSFVKARLNCSIPGEFPFYFDEIQASTHIVASSAFSASPGAPNAEGDLLYAVFTTPTNSIGGSAVCAFRMSDVLAAFDGPFKAQADGNANWLPVPESRVPQLPRPGTCSNDSKQLPDEHINFIKDNPLMDTAVEAVWSQPLVMMASINFRFTQIAVDAQVELQPAPGAAQMRTDVIFVATDDGRVFKLTNTHHLFAPPPPSPAALTSRLPPARPGPRPAHPLGAARPGAPLAAPQVMGVAEAAGQRESLPDISGSTIVIEELHLFDARTPIVNLMIHQPSPRRAPPEQQLRPKLLVLSGKQFKAIPLSRCERALTCADCLALYDPYCTWDARQQLCQSTGRSWAWHRAGWFPPNNGLPAPASNLTLAWWSGGGVGQCAAVAGGDPSQLQQQVVGAPYRSLFSSHLQVPSRFDYASGHHLSHSPLVSPANAQLAYQRQQPVSECLTFCGGPTSIYQPPVTSAGGEQSHFVGSLPTPIGNSNLYTSENLYFAVIFCAVAGLALGLLFGFALGKSNRKHDSSVCSSTFDETNLYMASTGSTHHGGNLFAAPPMVPSHNRPLLGAHNGTLLLGGNGLRQLNTMGSHLHQQQQLQSTMGHMHNQSQQQQLPLYDVASPQLSGSDCAKSIYGQQQQKQQQMMLHLASNSGASNNSATMRTGNLPPIPSQTAPLVNTQLATGGSSQQPTPSGSSASSTNTSSTSTTMPMSVDANQMYLNHHQLVQQQQQQQNQRSFKGGGSAKTKNHRIGDAASQPNNQQGGIKHLNNSQQQQQQLQNDKIYL